MVVRPIAIDMRLCLRPGAVEQRDEPMLEQIEKPAERRIAGMAEPMPSVLRDVNRQRTIGPDQAEQPYLQARRRALLAEFDRMQRGRGEREVRVLTQPERLVDGTTEFQ